MGFINFKPAENAQRKVPFFRNGSEKELFTFAAEAVELPDGRSIYEVYNSRELMYTRETNVSVGDVRVSMEIAPTFYFECIKGGTTGSSNPNVRRVVRGDIVVDGSAEWETKEIVGSGGIEDIIIKLEPLMKAEKTRVRLNPGESETIKLSYRGDGTSLTAESTDNGVATARISGKNVIISRVSDQGDATITVSLAATDNYRGDTVRFLVTSVKPFNKDVAVNLFEFAGEKKGVEIASEKDYIVKTIL